MPAVTLIDVVTLNTSESPTGTATATIEEHLNFVRQGLGGIAEKLLDEGIEAKYLGVSSGSNQWQTGRLKLSFEFIPDPLIQAASSNLPTVAK